MPYLKDYTGFRIVFISAFLFLVLAGLFLSLGAPEALAQSEGQNIVNQVEQGGIVPCTGTDCTVCHLYEGIRIIIFYLLTAIVLPVAVIAVIAGGAYWLLSAGNPEKISTGKSILWWAIIGFILAFAAWVIVNTLLDTLGFQFPGPNPGAWNDFSICQDIQNQFFGGVGAAAPPPSGPPPPPAPPPQNCPNCANLSVPQKPGACAGTAQGQTCQINSAMNTKLVSLNQSILNDGKPSFWWVTEAWPPTVQHQDPCHSQGTCVDANLLGSARGNAADIIYFIQKANAAGLRPVYEVQNDIRKQQLISQRVPASSIITVPGINAEHFSIYNS